MSNSVHISYAMIYNLERDGRTIKDSQFIVRIGTDEITAEVWDYENAEQVEPIIHDKEKLDEMIMSNCSQDELETIMAVLRAREGFWYYDKFVDYYTGEEKVIEPPEPVF